MKFTTLSITVLLIDDVKLDFVCLIDDLKLDFCYINLETGNGWTRTCIDYHPCITSEPTRQVCYSSQGNLVKLRLENY